MNILVTGGAGFIGSNITERYLELGHSVTVIDDLSTGKIENISNKADFIQIDIADKRIDDIIREKKIDIISHHAAQMDVRKSVADPIFDANINIIGSLNIYESAVRNKVKKIIFASSGGTVYGEQTEHPCTEEHLTNPCSPYGISKLINEKYLQYYKEVYGLDYSVFRYGNVYGPKQNPHGEAGVVAIFTSKLLSNVQPIINGDGLITRDYIYIDDVIEANVLALQNNISGIFNITTGVEKNVNEIFRTLKSNIGSEIEEFHGPAKSGEQRRSCCSFAKFNSVSGWVPKVNFEDGIKKTVEYFQKIK